MQARTRPRGPPGESGSELGLNGLLNKETEGPGWISEDPAGLWWHSEKEKFGNGLVWESESLRERSKSRELVIQQLHG